MGFKYTYNYGAAFCTAASSWGFYQARFWNAWGVTFLTPQMADLFRLFHRCWIFGFDPWQCRFKTMDKYISYHVYIYIYITIHTLHIFMAIYISLMETDHSSLSRILSYIYMLTHTWQACLCSYCIDYFIARSTICYMFVLLFYFLCLLFLQIEDSKWLTSQWNSRCKHRIERSEAFF